MTSLQSSDSAGGAPAWLFSFVDLAFLLLIATTQIADVSAPELGEIVVPRIESEATANLPSLARERWQLRVHPPGDDSAFELAQSSEGDERLAYPALRERLAELNRSDAKRPLLAPHENSRSRDLLDALTALEEFWPSQRRATIERIASLGS